MFKEISIKKISSFSLLGAMVAGGIAISSNAAANGQDAPFVIETPSVPVPTRAVVNPSFESPYFPIGNDTWITLDNYIPGNEDTLQGWFSTHPTDGFPGVGSDAFSKADGSKFEHLIELWANGHAGVHSAVGTQHIELNAQANSAVYQDILVFQGEQIRWSAAHRGRSSSSVADVAEVFISDPADWTGATFNGTRLYSAQISTSNAGSASSITPITGNVPSSTSMNSLDNGWVQYSDVWKGPAVSKKYRFAFQAVSSAQGNSDLDLTFGNMLDNIQIQLAPIVDLIDPKIDEIKPYGNSTYYLPLRVNGKLDSTATVEIDVSLDSLDFTNYNLEDLVSGTNEAIVPGVVATKLDNGNIQVTLPESIYDPNNPADYITVPIDFDQLLLAQDKTAEFTIVSVNGGGDSGVQNLLIPPADSGFAIVQETIIKPVFAD